MTMGAMFQTRTISGLIMIESCDGKPGMVTLGNSDLAPLIYEPEVSARKKAMKVTKKKAS